MVKKEFSFKGKSLAELQAMDLKEFSTLVNSRARRSLERGFDKHTLKKINKAAEIKKQGKLPKAIRTHKRDLIIIPAMIGLNFAVHRGNNFEQIEIKPKMLGHFIGEMVLTRKRLLHGKAGIGATRSSTAITARG